MTKFLLFKMISTSTMSNLIDFWKDNYEGIAQANMYIMNEMEMTEDQIDPNVKAGFIAEARFLHYYSIMNY